MPRSKPTVLAAALFAALLVVGAAHAQFGGMYTLPKTDFVWNWGHGIGAGGGEEAPHRSHEDFSVSGFEAGFNCDLTGAMRIGSQLTTAQIRDLQTQLRASIRFIYDTSNIMNDLDRSFDLDWAQLGCKKHEPADATAEQKAEREAKARDKTLREVERRRARAQKEVD